MLAYIPTELPQGFYLPGTLEPVEFDGQFPDWKRILKKHNAALELTNDSLSNIEQNGRVWQAEALGSLFNKSYLDIILSAGNADINYHSTDRNEPIQGSNQYGTFLLMPMRN